VSKRHKCPNCGKVFTESHPENGCALALFATVVRDRGDLTQEQINKLVVNCDTDALWEYLGALISRFEEGDFNHEGDD
jgi:hypothetical protein